MKELALQIEGVGKIIPPNNEIPTGGLTTLSKILTVGVNFIFIAAILLTLVFLLYGGFLWMTSEGNKQTLENARKTLTFAIIGLVIVLLSFAIINGISYFFNIPLLPQVP